MKDIARTGKIYTSAYTSVRRQKGLTAYCYKYIDRPFCLRTDKMYKLFSIKDINLQGYLTLISHILSIDIVWNHQWIYARETIHCTFCMLLRIAQQSMKHRQEIIKSTFCHIVIIDFSPSQSDNWLIIDIWDFIIINTWIHAPGSGNISVYSKINSVIL